LCSSFVATVPSNESVAVNLKTIEAGKNSGYPSLNQGATALVKAIDEHRDVAISTADAQIVAACEHADIPLGTSNS
jgi:hypothetical protein